MSQKEFAANARRLLKAQSFGVLATQSAHVPGYPYGSLLPYVMSNDCEPIILISALAQHTHNIQKDHHVSLTVFDPYVPDVQAAPRITWLGNSSLLNDADGSAKKRYLRYFPSAERYFQLGDFKLYRIDLNRAHYIGGFGQIHWIEPSDLFLKNALAEMEDGIIEHMNEDHKLALIDYCRAFKSVTVAEARMIGIDSEGFDMMGDDKRYRFEFDELITTAEDARKALVALVKKARMTQ